MYVEGRLHRNDISGVKSPMVKELTSSESNVPLFTVTSCSTVRDTSMLMGG